MLISGGCTVLVTLIVKVYQYLDKKKNKALQEQVEKLQRDVDEIKKISVDNRSWIQKLEDDLDYLMKLLLDKSLKK
jgi:cell division protein FtsB